MKRTLQTLFGAAVAAASLVSCAKEVLRERTLPAGEEIQVAVGGSIGDFVPADGTKANAESVVRVTWTKGDNVYVYDGSACLGTLTVTPNEDNASHALLSGTINPSSASPAPSRLALVYVKGAETAPAISDGTISVDISSQNSSDVPFVLYAGIEYDKDKLVKKDEYVPFSFATSVMTVNCTGLPTGAEKTKIDITKAEIGGVSTACELTVDGDGVTSVSGAKTGTVTRTAGFEQSDSRGAFKLALAADPSAPEARTILVYQGGRASGAPFTSATLSRNKSYNTVYQLSEYVPDIPAGALTGVFTVADDGAGNVKKVYFSQGNLYYDGSNWGFEAEQYYFRTYCDGTKNGGKCDAGGYNKDSGTASGHWGLFGWVGASSTTLTSSPGIYGVTTSTSDSDYGDVAGESLKADWGKAIDDKGTWTTLSGGDTGEWKYLFDHHVNVWGTCKDVPGRFIAPDGFEGDAAALLTAVSDWQSAQTAGIVFLPAAGRRLESTVSKVGGNGDYWSSTAYDFDRAYTVDFGSTYVGPTSYVLRYRGYSVRLITECQ